MDINYMKSLITIVEEKNFQKAAHKLEISHSELLKHISKIEEEIHMPVFKQNTLDLELTKYGELFLNASMKIWECWNQGNRALGDFYFQGKTQLAIGSISVMVPYKITDMIYQFRQAYPEINLHVFSENDYILKSKLQERQIELAFLHGRIAEDENFENLLYYEDCSCVILPSHHPKAEKKELSIWDLEDESFLLLPEKTGIYQEFDRLCKETGFSPDIGGTFRNSSSILDLITKNCGIGFMMYASAMAQMRDGLVVKKIVEKSDINIYLSHYREHTLSEAAGSFWDYIKLHRIAADK